MVFVLLFFYVIRGYKPSYGL